MKKLLAVLFVAAIMAVGVFAEDVKIPTGSFIDSMWNAEWVIGVDTIELKDATSGELIYSFTKDKRADEKLEVTTEGPVWSFYCAETARKYYFSRPISLGFDTGMYLEIDPDWTSEDYKQKITLKK